MVRTPRLSGSHSEGTKWEPEVAGMEFRTWKSEMLLAMSGISCWGISG